MMDDHTYYLRKKQDPEFVEISRAWARRQQLRKKFADFPWAKEYFFALDALELKNNGQ